MNLQQISNGSTSRVTGIGATMDRRQVVKLVAGASALALGGGVVATQNADAAGGGSLKTTAVLNLRSGPGTSHKVLLVIPNGSHVFDNGEQKNGFRKVTYNNTRGWASAQYLKAGTQIPGEAGPVVGTRVTTTAVNFRSGPSTGDSVIQVLAKGSTVEITNTLVDGFRYSYFEGRGGWVYDAYLGQGGDNGGSTLTVTTALNLRAKPSTSARVLAVMPEGAKVQSSGDGANGFAKVKYQGTWGWAWTAYLN